MDEFHNAKSPTEDDALDHQLPLRTAPSFAIYNSNEGFGDGDTEAEEVLKRTITIGQSIEALGSGEFSFGKKEIDLIEEEEESEKDGLIRIQKLGVEDEVEPASPPMYLAAGLGVDGTGFGFDNCTSDDLSMPILDGSGDVEEHYKRMVVEYPCHPLILRNYAQILQSKGDLHSAEEYFLRATLADPNNGEILVQYAKLVWDLHHDKQRALQYFERAAQAAPPDSHVLAAYASFLWETEDDDEEGGKHNTNGKVRNENNERKIKLVSPPKQDNQPSSPFLHPATGQEIGAANVTAANYGKDTDIEDYYGKMIDENPANPLFLRSYAQFLIQSKGDLHRAEECFSRSTLADPDDGEILMQYAQLLWELHQDKDKALTYFVRAAQAAPLDSDVLAAYASFLWEIEDDEEEGGKHQSNSEEKEEHEQHTKIVRDDKIEIDAEDLTLANCGKEGSVEDYYKKMIDENPDNSFFLKNYAQFLIQSKKDLQAAEKYYSCAILADPSDGEMISEYAKLEWELHHDWRKALVYFEQAVQATPEDRVHPGVKELLNPLLLVCSEHIVWWNSELRNNVLAAYACFLWETEDVEAEISR